VYIDQAARMSNASHDPIAAFFLREMSLAQAAEASA